MTYYTSIPFNAPCQQFSDHIFFKLSKAGVTNYQPAYETVWKLSHMLQIWCASCSLSFFGQFPVRRKGFLLKWMQTIYMVVNFSTWLSINKSSVQNLHWTRIYLEKSFKCHCIKLGSLLCSATCLEKITYMYIFAHRKKFPYFPDKTFLDAYSCFFTQGNEYWVLSVGREFI